MNKELNLPVFNYKNEFSVRQVQPISLEYKHSDYHGECWHLSGYDFNKGSIRDFEFDKVIRGVVHFTLETLGKSPHSSKVDGIMNKLKEREGLNKEFTVETFNGMIRKVVEWNKLGGNDVEDKSLIPTYIQLSKEETFSQGELLQGWFTQDKVMIGDGIADLIYTAGYLAELLGCEIDSNYLHSNIHTGDESLSVEVNSDGSCLFSNSKGYFEQQKDGNLCVNKSSAPIEGCLSNVAGSLINFDDFSKEMLKTDLYLLCKAMNKIMDVEAIFEVISVSNYSKFLHEETLDCGYCLNSEVRYIEEQGRYKGVDYHQEGDYYIFTAKEDLKNGVVFDKPKVVKHSKFKEPEDFSEFIY